MSFVRAGASLWLPQFPWNGSSAGMISSSDTGLVDADQEEVQIIGTVNLAAGASSKTFGTSGSKVGWLPGASVTFAASSTLRVGVKKTTIDNANGPPARATIGGAAFDTYRDLVGGTDTITSTTWRDDAMNTGSSLTVNQGDIISVCFLLSTSGGTPSVKVRGNTLANTPNLPAATLVTSGPTFTAINSQPDIILTFDDGSIGWLTGSFIWTGSSSPAVGNGVIYGNVFQPPFDCKVDSVIAYVAPAGSANFDVGLWSDPLGTPTAMTSGTVSVDPQNMASGSIRLVAAMLPAEIQLSKNTNYAVGVRQNSATSISVNTYDVNDANHLQANGLDSNCYAATSTSGAAFAQQNSGKRRAAMWVRVSQIDDGTGRGFPARTFTGF